MLKRIARGGLLVALAFVFSYIEVLIPVPIGIPGFKLGLANLVVVVSLYYTDLPTTVVVSLTRILLVGLTFAAPSTLLFSLAGGAASLFIMWLCMRYSPFGTVGVSVAGGVIHNIAQAAVALLVITPAGVLAYLPMLLIIGSVTGALIGIAALLLLKRLPPAEK